MAYTLNTSHPLYPNLVELIGVKDGALVSHKTARTFTKHADATFGTGTYGEHFAALAGGYTAKGASFSPYLSLNTSTKQNYTVVAVLNSSGAVQGGTNSSFLSRTAGGDTIRSGGKDSSGNAYGYRVTGASMGTGARMITYCRIGETAAKLYNNTTLDVNATGLGADYNSPDARADYLCGWDGQNSITASLVWLAVFDKEPTLAEITDLYNSLGPGNTFGLVESAGGSTHNVTIANSQQSNQASTGSISQAGGATAIAIAASQQSNQASAGAIYQAGAASGILTTDPLTTNNGSIYANSSGWTLDIFNASTSAFVVRKTGLTTSAAGILTVSDPLIVAGTEYSYDPRHAIYGRALPVATAT